MIGLVNVIPVDQLQVGDWAIVHDPDGTEPGRDVGVCRVIAVTRTSAWVALADWPAGVQQNVDLRRLRRVGW